MKQERQMKVYT